MLCSLLLPLVVSLLLHTTASESTVYYVMPDNHYHPINDNTYTLQHYLNNTNKYFTSNTQLHFLPGQYYLNNDLIIQGISNFSLIGNRTNEVINTVINCTSPAGIIVVSSSNIVITNIVMNECQKDYYNFLEIDSNSIIRKNLISLFVSDCVSFTCTFFHSLSGHKACGIILFNVTENTTLENISSSNLVILHKEDPTENATLPIHFLSIDKFQILNDIRGEHAIKIEHTSVSYEVKITNVIFTTILAIYVNCIDCSNHTTTISKCSFIGLYETSYSYDNESSIHEYENEYSGNNTIDLFDLFKYDSKYAKIFGRHTHKNYRSRYEENRNQIVFVQCTFTNNFYPSTLIEINKHIHAVSVNNTDMSVAVTDCTFYNNSNVQILSITDYSARHNVRIHSAENFINIVDCYNYTLLLLIENVSISLHNATKHSAMIFANQISLVLDNVIITENSGIDHSIITVRYCDIKFINYNEFSKNNFSIGAIYMMESLMFLQENSTLNFTFNDLTYMFHATTNTKRIKMCPLQYISARGKLDIEFEKGIKLNYSIQVDNNRLLAISNTNMMHCRWHPSSAFQVSSPLHVNHAFIMNDDPSTMLQSKEICLCINKSFSCYIEELGPIYPGQTLSFHLIHTVRVFVVHAVFIEILTNRYITCRSNISSFIIQLDSKSCTKVEYLIKHPNGKWCELSIQVEEVNILAPQFNSKWIEMYTITLLPCPKGFSLHSEGYCQCDTILSSHIPSLTDCNIDDQTIPRPANSWISAHTVNNSHYYHVSLHCPFDYCLPHLSHLNLFTPDTQCQFNRTGLLCGQCQQGLSAVFGSSQCKQCTNVYLLIIIPIGIAGIVLVLLLFALNLTVTDGSINGFLFYVNIININASVFFPTTRSVAFTFISLANLDLGIETCFYNGMDEYAKMWLQLAFPAYLIFIATSIIVASHYSGRIQRLTARRALSVLATLFLLSYTKVLLNVSGILFFYSTITTLPNNDTRLMWSVDANVPLFGVKFTVLFASGILLFLVLIPFNISLIFTRPLFRFRVITYFKPILDAYQGPYKIKFYYWTGLQLFIRAVFFGLSALDKNINLILSIIFLGAFVRICEKLTPFKSKKNTVIEALFLSNLFVMFAISIDAVDIQTYNIMIDILISLAMFQFLCGVVIHLKKLFIKRFPKYDVKLNFGKLSLYAGKWFLNFRKQERPRCNLELVNPVPEKAYDYEEFQEPVIAIGQD